MKEIDKITKKVEKELEASKRKEESTTIIENRETFDWKKRNFLLGMKSLRIFIMIGIVIVSILFWLLLVGMDDGGAISIKISETGLVIDVLTFIILLASYYSTYALEAIFLKKE